MKVEGEEGGEGWEEFMAGGVVWHSYFTCRDVSEQAAFFLFLFVYFFFFYVGRGEKEVWGV